MSPQGATPAPWIQSLRRQPKGSYLRQVHAADEQLICTVASRDCEANARLIAQSPALLAALKLIVKRYWELRQHDIDILDYGCVISQAEELCTAAEGSDRP